MEYACLSKDYGHIVQILLIITAHYFFRVTDFLPSPIIECLENILLIDWDVTKISVILISFQSKWVPLVIKPMKYFRINRVPIGFTYKLQNGWHFGCYRLTWGEIMPLFLHSYPNCWQLIKVYLKGTRCQQNCLTIAIQIQSKFGKRNYSSWIIVEVWLKILHVMSMSHLYIILSCSCKVIVETAYAVL